MSGFQSIPLDVRRAMTISQIEALNLKVTLRCFVEDHGRCRGRTLQGVASGLAYANCACECHKP